MVSFKVALFVRDQEYAETIEKCVLEFYDKFPGLEIDIISDKPIKTRFNNINLSEIKLSSPIDKHNVLLDNLNNKYWLNKEIYKADPNFVFNNKKIDYLDQIELTLKIRNLFDKKSYNLVLAGGAAYLIWTIPILISLEKGIPAYKIQTFNYINPNYEGVRIWFCPDPFWDLDKGNENDFSWKDIEMEKHITSFKKSITSGKFNLASDAIKIRESFTPNKTKNILKNLIKLIISNDNVAKFRLSSFFNEKLNRKHYVEIADVEKNYFLFPLNQPYDEQLLFRSPEFKNNLETINLIANNLPRDAVLLIKEHPVNPGMIKSKDIRDLLNKYNNVKFISPEINLYDALVDSVGLITINSTSGLEALVHNKNVLVLGRGYYRKIKGIYKQDSEKDLNKLMIKMMNESGGFNNQKELDSTLKKILNQTYPGPNNFPHKEKEYLKTLSEAIEYKLEQLYLLR